MTNYHFVVLVHGLWGNVSHFDYICNALHTSAKDVAGNSEVQLVIYRASLNEGFKTYDGIDICGFRVAKEISEQIEEFENTPTNVNDRITKFSIVGYSLGGLIARYAIGLMYKTQFFKKRDIELLNFTTFCTPHVGVLAPGHNFAVRLFNSTVPWLLGNSGKQMFLKDAISGNGGSESLPLIYLMSLQSSIFYKALESFKYKSLYANIINDKRTAWWTSGISLNDPFFNINSYNGAKVFQYIEGYQTVVVNRNNPIIFSKLSKEESDCDNDDRNRNGNGNRTTSSQETDDRKELAGEDYYFLNYWFIKIFKWLMVMMNLLIIAPLFLIWKIVQSSTEMAISTIRVTRFVNRYSHQLLHDFFDIYPLSIIEIENETITENDDDECDEDFYSLNPTVSRTSSVRSGSNNLQELNNYLGFERPLNDQTDTLIESIYDAIERKNTHAGFLEKAPSIYSNIDSESLALTIRELENTSIDQLISRNGSGFHDIIRNLFLDLPQRQVDIIKSLNQINWEKYPIYIRDTPSTHACAIVRQNDPNFHEGEIVIKHWVDQVFRKA